MKKKILTICIISIFLLINISSFSVMNSKAINGIKFDSLSIKSSDNSTEYWAVIAGYGWEIYADDDAQDMRNVLVNHGWQDDHIKLLKHWDATRENIIKAIREIGTQENENDVVLFYFSGYSIYGIIFPYNSNIWPELQMMTRCRLSWELNKLESKNMIIIFQISYAKSMIPIFPSLFLKTIDQTEDQDDTETIMSSNIKGLTTNLARPGRVILMATKRFETAYFHIPLRNSVFGYFVVEAFEGLADLDLDGWVSAEEAFSYTKDKTQEYLSEYGMSQHPQIYDTYEGELKITQTNQYNFSLQAIHIQNNNLPKSINIQFNR